MSRQQNNIEILKILNKVILQNPDMRFLQLLWALNIINIDIDNNGFIEDRFYEESDKTLEFIKKEAEHLLITDTEKQIQ